jgi:hypothetical protein
VRMTFTCFPPESIGYGSPTSGSCTGPQFLPMNRNRKAKPCVGRGLRLAVELSPAGKPLRVEVGDLGGKVHILDESHTACPMTIKRFPAPLGTGMLCAEEDTHIPRSQRRRETE